MISLSHNKITTIDWGNLNASLRGALIFNSTNGYESNVIGAPFGPYSIHRAIQKLSLNINGDIRPDFRNTIPKVIFPTQTDWTHGKDISFIDPLGHQSQIEFKKEISLGAAIHPSIAITRANLRIPELNTPGFISNSKFQPGIFSPDGEIKVIKIAFDPVWYLPGIAQRFGIAETVLREHIFQSTNKSYPELISNPEKAIFLPPIGGHTVYVFTENQESLDFSNSDVHLRIHDECNSSDVFGSDLCTCRPYLIHSIQKCIEAANKGHVGIVIYSRNEGRALGELTKFLVYNKRTMAEQGDSPEDYFNHTIEVAGMADGRLHEANADILKWFGIKKLASFISMSPHKSSALISNGIEIDGFEALPSHLVPPAALTEITAKMNSGYRR